jgi:hypothetical protein
MNRPIGGYSKRNSLTPSTRTTINFTQTAVIKKVTRSLAITGHVKVTLKKEFKKVQMCGLDSTGSRSDAFCEYNKPSHSTEAENFLISSVATTPFHYIHMSLSHM